MTNVRPHRLYAKGRVLGFRRSKRNTKEHTSLLQVENRVAYVYRAKKEVNGSRVRAIWGKVTRTHGNNGVVRAKFRSNLPPKAFGAAIRIVTPLPLRIKQWGRQLFFFLLSMFAF
ncbi:ribosomal protein L35Ae-domain-containing protein [Chytridium lagenaria]|nr:ribosomal protein L35Ae-domain-containing protein [Chytridium lagenaria]